MINIQQIVDLHRDLVVRWHQQPIDCPYDRFLGVACRQASFNFLLWHTQTAAVKRRIDKLNQQRNDWIETLDASIAEQLAGVQTRR